MSKTKELVLRLSQSQAAKGAAVAALLGSVAGVANAAIDISAITAAGTDVAAVGAAVFLVYVGIKVFKMVRASL